MFLGLTHICTPAQVSDGKVHLHRCGVENKVTISYE
jgi:hypothetical protein